MTEERITTTETPDAHGGTTTHTTIIEDRSPSGGGSGWLIGIVLLVAIIAGIWFFTQTSASEMAKDNAIAEAADNVGEAAQSVGDAASDAGQAVEEAADKIAN